MSNFFERFSSPLEFGTQYWWCALFAAFSWYSWLLIVKKPYKKLLSLPPGPPALPLLGNLLSLEQPLLPYFSKLSQTYGPIFTLKLGSKICITISSSDLAKAILRDQDVIFANHDISAAALALTYGGMDMICSPNGLYWRKLRRIFVREIMSRATLDACYELRRLKVREMVKNINRKLGSPVNLTEQVFTTSTHVVTSMLWGENEKSSNGSEFRGMVKETVDLLATPNLSEFFPVLARFDFQGVVSKTKKLSSSFDKIFEPILTSRMNKHGGKEETKDLLHFLLEMNRKQNDKTLHLSVQEVKVLFMDMIIAATDTTSSTVEWAMAEMLRHPDKMRRASQEVDAVVGTENTVEEFPLSKLIYLNALIKETLRLYPPAPLLVPHKPSISCSVAGYTIPEGSRVFINVWAMHRDPEVWERAHEFEPERFLKGDFFGNNNFNYLPFGYGRRICAGIPLAEKMILYLVATLLHSFDWKVPDGVELDMSGRLELVTRKMVPLFAIPTARLPIDHYLSKGGDMLHKE